MGGGVIILESSQHFSIFTEVNVESRVLISLEFLERNFLKLEKRGVGAATGQNCSRSETCLIAVAQFP